MAGFADLSSPIGDKDGTWYTLCLPFDLAASNLGPLEGATICTLDGSTLNGDELTINFKQVTQVEAGKPYLIKWEQGDNIENHKFFNVEMKNVDNATLKGGDIYMKGNYTPITLSAGTDVLYLGDNNGLYYPEQDMTVNAFRALFFFDEATAGEMANPNNGYFTDKWSVTIPQVEHGTVTCTKQTAFTNETVTLTVTPNPKYELKELTVVTALDGAPAGAATLLPRHRAPVEVTQGDNGDYTFKMPPAPVTVNATFGVATPTGVSAPAPAHSQQATATTSWASPWTRTTRASLSRTAPRKSSASPPPPRTKPSATRESPPAPPPRTAKRWGACRARALCTKSFF